MLTAAMGIIGSVAYSYSPNNVSLVFGVFVCSGGFAAAVTTPLDVAKTRIMLAKVRMEEPADMQVNGLDSFSVVITE